MMATFTAAEKSRFEEQLEHIWQAIGHDVLVGYGQVGDELDNMDIIEICLDSGQQYSDLTNDEVQRLYNASKDCSDTQAWLKRRCNYGA